MPPGTGEDLGDAHERRPPGPDLAVAPGLHRNPVHDLLVVELLALAEDLPGPARGAGAAHVDRDVRIAVPDQIAVERESVDVARRTLVVAGLGQDDRQRAFDRVAVGIRRQHHLCRQQHAVAHRNVFGRQADGVRIVVVSLVVDPLGRGTAAARRTRARRVVRRIAAGAGRARDRPRQNHQRPQQGPQYARHLSLSSLIARTASRGP